jgi:hypothetical protein
MKYIILSLTLFYFQSIYCQNELPTKDGRVFYEEVDSSVIASKSQLYDRAKVWFTNSFKDSKEVIQLDDKEAGTIIGKGIFNFYRGLTPCFCNFSIRVDSKENKFRIQVYDITVDEGLARIRSSAEFYNKKKNYEKLKKSIDTEIRYTILNLKTKISSTDSF